MKANRRSVLKGIGAGTALLVAPAGASSAEEDEAGLRVAHASPDAPAVDLFVDGSEVIEGLEFRSVTDYLEVPAGEYDIAVTVAGTDTTVFSAEGVALDAEDYPPSRSAWCRATTASSRCASSRTRTARTSTTSSACVRSTPRRTRPPST